MWIYSDFLGGLGGLYNLCAGSYGIGLPLRCSDTLRNLGSLGWLLASHLGLHVLGDTCGTASPTLLWSVVKRGQGFASKLACVLLPRLLWVKLLQLGISSFI